MNQSLNIFRKDAANLMPQLLMPLCTLALFTVLESRSWTTGPMLLFSTPALNNVLAMLFYMSWTILIISLIQAERLVGLNQFWTTRPYEWPKLIAAKALLLLAFLYLPLIVSQMVLLHQAHLPVMHSIPALLHNLLLLTCIFVLPVTCAAALTRSIVQAVLALLVFIAMLVALAVFATSKDLAPQNLALLVIILIAATLIAAIANQYRNRTTTRSLYLLAIAPAIALLLEATVPGTSLSALEYHPPAAGSPVSVQFDSNPLRAFGSPANSIRNPTDPLRAHAAALIGDPATTVLLHIPLLVSVPDTHASFALDAHRISLTAANGTTWQSPWLSESGMLSPPTSDAFPGSADFAIPKSVYQRLGNGAVTVRIDFALTQLQNQPPTRTTLSTTGEFIPALGFCALDESYSVVTCRSAFRNPPRFAVETSRKIGPCTAPDAAIDPIHGIIGEVARTTITPHITSVDVTPLQLSSPARAGYLCPCAPIDFTEQRIQTRLKVEMPPATIHLSDYIASSTHN